MLTGILQPSHLILILIVALLFLEPRRLPDAGRALGQGLKEFRSSISTAQDEDSQIAPASAAEADNPKHDEPPR